MRILTDEELQNCFNQAIALERARLTITRVSSDDVLCMISEIKASRLKIEQLEGVDNA